MKPHLGFAGSPPHTRGKENASAAQSRADGITPAHAGKRNRIGFFFWSSRDHPRTRGEKNSAGIFVKYSVGSPPHTRGKACGACICPVANGITPAHAGKSGGITKYGTQYRGSPPHSRGKVISSVSVVCSVGITPAHAGKSPYLVKQIVGNKDHPRTRGEKNAKATCKRCTGGSPPHTRGKVFQAVKLCTRSRITPAHAGKSRSC